MIRLLLAFWAKVFLAFRAPYPINTHMFLSSFADIFSIVIFIGADLSLNDLNHVSAGAFYEVQLALQSFACHFFLKFIIGIFAQNLANFCFKKLFLTVLYWTEWFWVLKINGLSETLFADHVITVFKIGHIGEVHEWLLTVATWYPLI